MATKNQLRVLRAILATGSWGVEQAHATRGNAKTIGVLIRKGWVEMVKTHPNTDNRYDLIWVATAAGCQVVNAADAETAWRVVVQWS
jgi:hypothetical protein